MAVAFVALLAALSGTAVALPGKNTVDSGDIKKGAVKTSDIAKDSVRGANVKNGSLSGADIQESSLGTVPSAETAASANTANTANSANTANTANNLGGAPASEYQRKTAQSGQTLSGQLAEVHNPGAAFWLAGGSYPVPLPAGTPAPTLEYRSDGSPNATCPGIGQSTSGRLCVYAYNTVNVASVSLSLNDENRLFGFSLDVFPADVDGDGYLLANWSYRVP